MADLPLDLPGDLSTRLRRSLDADGKIVRALDGLGPIAGRDVVLVGGGPGRTAELLDRGARSVTGVASEPGSIAAPDGSADVVVSLWSAFRAADAGQVADAERVLRPGGRLLAVHDYGRDDVSRLRGPRPEYGTWSRRDGPFLRSGFKIRVIHAFWTFESLEDAASFLDGAFGEPGREVASTLKRPRLTYKVAVFHRSVPGADVPG
jgi:hypothetical protein